MAERLAGKAVADAIKESLTQRVVGLKAKDITPKLGIVRVGARPDDLFYEVGIKKTCEFIGMEYEVFEYPTDVDQEGFEKAIINVGQDNTINGVLMFAPLPRHLDERKIRSMIPVEKDVDSMNPASAAKVYTDDPTGFAPGTPSACMEILKYYNIPLQGKRAVVIGRSLVIGKPAAMLLLRENATVTICHSKTEDLPTVSAEADILIAAIGRPKMVRADYVRPGMTVIDVGINEDPDNAGKYVGDVDYAEVEPIVDKITPVPGGVGPVTTAVLCKHTVTACEMQHNLL